MSSVGNSASHSKGSLDELRSLANQADQSTRETNKSLTSISGKFVSSITGIVGNMPAWASRHIEIHKQLLHAVREMEAKGEGHKIPPDVIRSLENSKEVVAQLANKVNYGAFTQAIKPVTPTVDQHGLLTAGEKGRDLRTSEREWQLNLGLLMNVHKRTQDPELKKKVEFLALNYLAKAAPIDLKELGLDHQMTEQLEEMFQLGVFQEATYHREAPVFDSHLSSILSQVFPNSPYITGNSFLTDTTEFQSLIPLFFTPMETPEAAQSAQGEKISTKDQVGSLVEGWSNNLSDAMVRHFERNPDDPFNAYIDPPIIADLTNIIADSIQTHQDPDKGAIFEGKMKTVEEGFEKAIDQCIAKLKLSHPEMCKTPEDEQKLRVFLKFNISSICRTEYQGVAVLKSVHTFMDPQHYMLPEGTDHFLKSKGNPKKMSWEICGDKAPRTNVDLLAMVNYSGIRIGGISGREKIFNFMSLEQLIKSIGSRRQITEYTVSGPNVVAFKTKDEITATALFKRFKANTSNEKVAESHPQVAILGKATADIIEGLMSEITAEQWTALNENPDTRMILQQSLFRLMQHLSDATSRTEDFSTFAQAIELAQSEIATILAITSPFKEDDFGKIYSGNLSIVPPGLKAHVKAGVAKSAMNTFAGVNAAVHTMSPKLDRAHGQGVYFEEVSFLGENKTVEEVLSQKDLSSVDLYVGEFHHNIDIRLACDHYNPGSVIEEVEQLLALNDGNPLTVAIDVTIDFINSPSAEKLLKKFEKQITDGNLNVVFFRSGQKFDMLGVDHFYGGPFWMVNNGGEQWKPFEQLTTSDTHKTDPLSMQWFCLANKYAPKSLDEYRGRIFSNARSILEGIPAKLQTGGELADQVRISAVSEEMQASFVDIKILHPHCTAIAQKMESRLAQRFLDAGVKMHQRASFGFYHANWNLIPAYHDDKGIRNVRINPGLNPEENQIILDFIREDIPAVLAEMEPLPPKSPVQ